MRLSMKKIAYRITRRGLPGNRATGPISVSVDSQCSRSGNSPEDIVSLFIGSETIGNSPEDIVSFFIDSPEDHRYKS